MAYFFFLGPEMPLPITPAALSIKTPSKNTTVTLINDGEINILKEGGLREISFEFLLPQSKYPFSNFSVSNYTATAFIPLLNEKKKSKKPFQFIVARLAPNNKKVLFFTNITAQIEDFSYDEDAKSHGLDVMCSISLKEWKPYSTKSIKVAEAEGKKVATVSNPRPTTKTAPKTVTVKAGDTLWAICKKHLGDGSKYKEIAKLNKLSNPNVIKVGQVLRLS